MARMVATKAALSIRVDALTDADGKSQSDAPSIGIENRAKLESRLRALEHTGDLHGAARFSGGGRKQERFEMKGGAQTYNTQADFVTTQREVQDPVERAVKVVQDVKEEKRRAKEERRAKRRAEKEKQKGGEEDESEGAMEVDKQETAVGEEVEKQDKKDKKRKRRESEINGTAVSVTVPEVQPVEHEKKHKKDKKRKHAESEANGVEVALAVPEVKVGSLFVQCSSWLTILFV
jgi:nucleolar protein 58